jgi:arylsulfatase A-like enzyme
MTGTRPNIVLFVADQLRADVLAPFAPGGRAVAHAPFLDALAADATVFTDAWVQHPVCGPSRVSFMTGWYPHVHGHRTLTNLLQPHQPNLLRALRDAGYHTVAAGHRGDVFAPGVTELSTDAAGWRRPPRHFFSPYPDPPGSARWGAMYVGRRAHDPQDGPVHDLDEATISTVEQWLADAPPEPWVLFVPLLFPHPPFEVEDPWYSFHEPADVGRPLPVKARAPAFHDALRTAKGYDRLTVEDWAEIRRTYFGMVSRVDHQLRRVSEAVERSGAGERTVTVFMSDHGEYAGDHGLVEKWPAGVEPSLTRCPLVVHDPRRSGGTVTAPVEVVDIVPTLLELAGVEPSWTQFGRTLVPALGGGGPTGDARPFAVTEGGFRPADEALLETITDGGPYETKGRLQHERPELVGLVTALRTPTHAYVHRPFGDDELYDRRSDPDELVDLSGDAAMAEVLAELRGQLLDWSVTTADVIRWERDPRFAKVEDTL